MATAMHVDVSDCTAADESTPFEPVLGDEDLWAHVLSFLPLKGLYAAASTSRFHRSLMRSSREHVRQLTIQMERRIPSTGSNDGYQPVIAVNEAPCRSGDAQDCVLLPLLRLGKPSDVSAHHRHLLRICTCYPRLTLLRIDVSPTPPDDDDVDPNLFGVERLIDVVSWMSRSAIQLRSDRRIGPHPWCLLGTSTVETLQLVARFDRQLEIDPEENEETCYRIRPLMSMCAASCARSLRSLDLSGLGPGVLAELLKHVLPLLRVLRLGGMSNGNSFGWQYERGHLGAVGRAFPGLTALDVGYSAFMGGVSSADVNELVTHCTDMQYLDLSMVMAYMDFRPSLRILAKKAPKLRALATHGLVLPTNALLKFSAGCPLLERLHFVNWTDEVGGFVQPDEFLAAVRAFPSLAHLDISGTVAPQEQLLTWLEERQRSGRPVQSLVVHDCCSPTGRTVRQQMDGLEALKAKALAISPSMHVSISWEVDCEWDPDAEQSANDRGITMDLLRPRQRMLDAARL